MKRLFAVAALAFAVVPAVAAAQSFEHRFIGRVVEFEPYNLQLDRGPHMYLHKGTVLRPRGLNLRSGMPVIVFGHQDVNGSFQADEVDLADSFEPIQRRYPL